MAFQATFHVRQAEYVLIKHVFDAFFLNAQLADKAVSAFQGRFESHVQPCHYRIYSLRVQVGKTDALCEQELVPGVFDIMLVVGIVYDALQVAFIVAYLHLQFKDIIRFHFIQKCFFVSETHNRSGNAGNISGRNTLFSVG